MPKRKQLTIPALVFGPVAHQIGHYWHVIRPAAVQACHKGFLSNDSVQHRKSAEEGKSWQSIV